MSSSVRTLLFTDVEGSTDLLRRAGDGYAALLGRHREIVRTAISSCGGVEHGTEGDSFFVSFDTTSDGVAAAVQAQLALQSADWPPGFEIRVRMGLHVGEVAGTDAGPIGMAIHHAARIANSAHGDQIVLSAEVQTLARVLPDGVSLRALGTRVLRDVGVVGLFQVVHPALRSDFPELRGVRAAGGYVPRQLTSFVGRDAEIANLATLLGNTPLVTLIGVGGCGKTRLAIETAASCAAAFPDGVWFVELASATDADGVQLAFASGLVGRTAFDGDIVDHIASSIGDKRLLAIVDNCEHVLDDAAQVIESVIQRCPAMAVLATSREPLMVPGERLVPLPSLSVAESERLFFDRARAELPNVEFDSVQSAAIAELCIRLDRLPLAIELAAARVRAFTPVDLAAALNERFRLLVGGRRGRAERHQTMRNTLDWSYNLCTMAEQQVFDSLSIFPSGFDIAAARAVVSGDDPAVEDVGDVIARLVDRSLVQRTARADGHSRYSLLETMRAYGREHLQHNGLSDDTRDRHARHIVSVVNALSLETLGPREAEARAAIVELLPDARAAFAHRLDRRQWDEAHELCEFGFSDSNREQVEMKDLLYATLVEQGERPPFFDAFALSVRAFDSMSIEEVNTQVWALIDAGWQAPSHRASYVPHSYITVGLDSSRVDEVFEAMGSLESAPFVTRGDAEYWAMRAVVGVAPRLVSEFLAGFAERADHSGSFLARAMTADIRGLLAWHEQDWNQAAQWFSIALELNSRDPVRWFTTTWPLFRLVAIAMDTGTVRGQDLTEPWQSIRDGGLLFFQPWAAACTSVALDKTGHPSLAKQFRDWFARNTDPNLKFVIEIGETLSSTGFSVDRQRTDPTELEPAITELFQYAADLDRPEHMPTRLPGVTIHCPVLPDQS